MTDLLSKYQKQQIEWQLKLNSEFPLEYVRREAALQYMKHPHKKWRTPHLRVFPACYQALCFMYPENFTTGPLFPLYLRK